MANLHAIVRELQAERNRLDSAIKALTAIETRPNTAGARRGRNAVFGTRTVSLAARRRMARAQRARWARVKSTTSQSKAAAPKRTLSPEAIEKIRRAKKKWWKERKAA